MHVPIEPSILYFGTPVILLSTLNEDGSANLAPMSSVWWLGWNCMLGLGAKGHTAQNLLREKEAVMNLPCAAMAQNVNRLARLTGANPVPPHKLAMGYRHEKAKFEASGLTAVASERVRAPRVMECPVQLEVVLEATHSFGTRPDKASTAIAFEMRVVRRFFHSRSWCREPHRPRQVATLDHEFLSVLRAWQKSRIFHTRRDPRRSLPSCAPHGTMMKGGDRMAEPKTPEDRREATLADVRWNAVFGRDRRADGAFFYSVRTTGVYCRPSCGARTPLPENVTFHGCSDEAEKAGFRPCKRCKPEQASPEELQRAMVAEACRMIERAHREPTLQQLATAAKLSASHFHRMFRSVVGLTPKQYAAAHRSKSVRESLARSGTVTEAIYEAGFQSNGRFYATSNQSLGMTPSAFRRGGANVEVRFAVGECKLGSVLIAQSVSGVCAILFGDDAQQLVQDLKRRFPRAELKLGEAPFNQLVAQVIGLVEASQTIHNLPLDIRGTAFQRRVWQARRPSLTARLLPTRRSLT